MSDKIRYIREVCVAMIDVPYLYVNLTALCCYIFIFVTFLAAKKNPDIKYFIVVMGGFILWTGGSILMRLRVFPGITFWFLVSIMSLFALAFLIFLFISSFARLKGFFLKAVLAGLTFLLEILTALGAFHAGKGRRRNCFCIRHWLAHPVPLPLFPFLYYYDGLCIQAHH